ncbi:hypothetical protein FH972_019661 [Carpinus fangiana]|uniref:Uncharacterized protein n=1 Tax=Carpinus fangiana TaxID=176857 RepID=A0A5N6RU20_9ROSI|nr:hypothetical protein FH972_019661 [Carpinus fangiana]
MGRAGRRKRAKSQRKINENLSNLMAGMEERDRTQLYDSFSEPIKDFMNELAQKESQIKMQKEGEGKVGNSATWKGESGKRSSSEIEERNIILCKACFTQSV